MKININKTVAVAALAIGGSVFAANSQAAAVHLSGTSSVYVTDVTISGPDLSAPGDIHMVNPTYGTNTGDYIPLVADGPFTFSPFLNLAIPSSWDILGPTATRGAYAVSQLDIIFQDSAFLNVHTTGIFTPGNIEGTQTGGCKTGGNTCIATDTVFRWSFTRSFNPGTGSYSVSASGTLASPSSLLPEPASLSLLGIGLLGMTASRRKAVTTVAAQ